MPFSSRLLTLAMFAAVFTAIPSHAAAAARATEPGNTRETSAPLDTPADLAKRAEYIAAITRGDGAGYMPWQERGLSRNEIDFRKQIEERKTKLLAERAPIKHPVLVDPGAHKRALKNIAEADWARKVAAGARERADFIVNQPAGYIDSMISTTTPWYDYGATCPNCVGVKSIEGVGHGLFLWDYKNPDRLTCKMCGQVYPSDKYPETLKLFCPRMNQTFTFYQNEAERAHPDDHSGQYAYKGFGNVHLSFSGLIRKNKVMFMINSVEDLSVTYIITQDPRYARAIQQILSRMAVAYRQWLYHDYRHAMIDADPLYAAWHDTELELVWKKHLATAGYARDGFNKASMMNFWGAGRIHPSTDDLGALIPLAKGYDLVADASDENGRPLWSAAERTTVERDLFLEWIFTGEPYLGGPDEARLSNNKAPRIYNAMAAVAAALNLPRLADTAMRGYELLRDKSFTADGFSVESPGYTMMYLEQMPSIPELLNNFNWPDSFPARKAAGDLYKNPKLRNIYRAMIDQLRPDGTTVPFEDSAAGTRIPGDPIQFGIKHYPEFFGGKAGILSDPHPEPAVPPDHVIESPGVYSLLNLDTKRLFGSDAPIFMLFVPEIPRNLKDTYFPNWMTALMRHGCYKNSALLGFNFSPPGSHRHGDNLTIYYQDHGDVMLGDLGYVGDSPVNQWIVTTFSHNLVIVDDKNQVAHSRENKRTPKLEQMLSTPRVSACEASSDAARPATEYRRLVVLLKGPHEATCAVDIFRVKGGTKHSYQLFSELGSSDAGAAGALTFEGVTIPPEPPLPNFGASTQREHIYGLRDTRVSSRVAPAWTATWTDPKRSYRFWCLGQVDKVTASNGPGQEVHAHPGRRVRVLNAVNEGKDSTFVGIHEPSLSSVTQDSGPSTQDLKMMPVKTARRLEVPPAAGPEAVALEIKTVWGDYIVLSEFANEATVEGVTFQGKLGIFGKQPNGKPWYLASGATTLKNGKTGFRNKPAEWAGTAAAHTDGKLFVTGRPAGWSDPPRGCKSYVIVNVPQNVPAEIGRFDTGYPVVKTTRNSITTERFPIPPDASNAFKLAALRYGE